MECEVIGKHTGLVAETPLPPANILDSLVRTGSDILQSSAGGEKEPVEPHELRSSICPMER